VTQNSSNAGMAESSLLESSVELRAPQLSDRVLFFEKFLNKGLQISSIVPSSRYLIQTVLGHVDFDRPSTLVELGGGTGVMTEQVVDRLRPHHRFATVENDPDFCRILRRRFPEAMLIEGDATDVAAPLSKLGIDKVDYVLCCLPTPNLPKRSQIRLMRWLRKSLVPGGLFIQITNAPYYYFNFYRRLFESVSYQMVWLNVPPGGVYRCARPRAPFSKPGD